MLIAGFERIMTLEGDVPVRDAFARGLSIVAVNPDLKTSPDCEPQVVRAGAAEAVRCMSVVGAWSRSSRASVVCGGRIRVMTVGGRVVDASTMRKNTMTSDVYGVIRSLRLSNELPDDMDYDDVYDVKSRMPVLIIVNDMYFEV